MDETRAKQIKEIVAKYSLVEGIMGVYTNGTWVAEYVPEMFRVIVESLGGASKILSDHESLCASFTDASDDELEGYIRVSGQSYTRFLAVSEKYARKNRNPNA